MYADTIMVAESHPSSSGSTADPSAAKWVTHRTVGLIGRWAVHLKTLRIRRRTTAQLSALDDRLLADIGIERNQIGTAAEGVLRATKVRDLAAASAVDGITNGDGRPAANDNGLTAEDRFESVARQWRDRRPADTSSGHPA
jgi:uncharacterized protein YjiS (DUF1127 family)